MERRDLKIKINKNLISRKLQYNSETVELTVFQHSFKSFYVFTEQIFHEVFQLCGLEPLSMYFFIKRSGN